jgi:hypothetical protein
MNSTFTRLLRKIAVTLPLLALSAWAAGDTNDESVWQKRDGMSISVGLYMPNYDTKIRKSNSATEGSEIDLEDDLGLDDDDELPVFSIAMRPWSRHKFFFSYMSMDRDAKHVLTEDLIFDGITFPEGTDVDTDFGIDMYRAGYTWSFLQNESWELGLSLGAYWLTMDMKLSAVDGVIQADYSESEPFPMIGFSGSWLPGKNWLVRATAEAFTIDMNDTEGDFYNVRVEAEYTITENIAIGAGYDLVGIDAKDTKKNNKVNYDYDGALVYVRWLF